MNEQSLTGIYCYKIHSYEADFKEQLSVLALLNFLQESAWLHASHYAFGYYDLLAKNCFWALTRMQIKIHVYPKWNDDIVVETWSKKPDPLIAYRDFEVFDQHKNLIVSASSAWLIVDIHSRRPQRIELFENNFPIIHDRHALNSPPQKIADKIADQSAIIHTVTLSDIDINGHVNNAQYIRWVLDSFTLEFHQHHNLKQFEVNFLHESKSGDHYTINLLAKDDLNYASSIIRADDGCELVRIKLMFEKI